MYTQPNNDNPLIKVRGDGELAIQPDTASVNIGVITENKELINAQQKNSAEMNKVIQALSSLGIPNNLLQTFDYRIDSDYDYEQGKQIFRGYKISHILQVKIEDLSKIGNIVDTAVQNGGNYVSNVQFTSKHKDYYYQKALSLAVYNAIEKAKTIASSIRVTLDPTPILVEEGGSTIQPILQPQMTYVKGVTSTQFEPGQLQIKASISADFQYKKD